MENLSVIKKIEDFLDKKKQSELKNLYQNTINKLKGELKKTTRSTGLDASKKTTKKIDGAKALSVKSELDSLVRKYEDLISLEDLSPTQVTEIRDGISKGIKEIDKKYNTANWISEVAKQADKVSLEVTHVAKLTHSSARASNINAYTYSEQSEKSLLVTTNCGQELRFDSIYSSASYKPVAEFLQQKCDSVLLGKLICSNPDVLKAFTKDEKQIEKWQQQISLAFEEKEKSSHTLCKQIYFSVRESHHLLMPLVSSSLGQVIRDRVQQAKKDSEEANKAKESGLFSEKLAVSYPKVAILKITQSNHQNVSSLNNERSGELFLLPSLPPQWKYQQKPPDRSIFGRQLYNLAEEPINKLRNLLLAIKFNDLSMNQHRRKLIINLVGKIADVVFDYVSYLHHLPGQAGWSRTSRLPLYEQYWLDPYRADEEFQAARSSIDWHVDISFEFSRWLNNELYHPKLTVGTKEEEIWRKLFSPLLREFNSTIGTAVENAAFKAELV